MVARAVSRNLSLQSFQMHDNNLGPAGLADLFSIMHVNKDIELKHNEKRIKIRATHPIL